MNWLSVCVCACDHASTISTNYNHRLGLYIFFIHSRNVSVIRSTDNYKPTYRVREGGARCQSHPHFPDGCKSTCCSNTWYNRHQWCIVCHSDSKFPFPNHSCHIIPEADLLLINWNRWDIYVSGFIIILGLPFAPTNAIAATVTGTWEKYESHSTPSCPNLCMLLFLHGWIFQQT